MGYEFQGCLGVRVPQIDDRPHALDQGLHAVFWTRWAI